MFWSVGFFSSLAYAGNLPISPHKLREHAVRYELGRGVEPDYHRARRLYCLAVVMGDRQSLQYLGWMNFKGLGYTSKAVAMGWFKRAAMRGDKIAQRLLHRYKDISPRIDSNCQRYKAATRISRAMIADWVRLIAPEFEMDPGLVLAVIAAESNFNPKARSEKNACGLMQLLPGTARRFGVSDIWNPVENIIGGTAYLNWLMNHFQGELDLVLAAYNAGENAVKRYRGIPPYDETRHYVNRILVNYRKTSPTDSANLQATVAAEQPSTSDVVTESNSGI